MSSIQGMAFWCFFLGWSACVVGDQSGVVLTKDLGPQHLRDGKWPPHVLSVDFEPEGDGFLSASRNETILWSKDGNKLATLNGHDGAIVKVAYTKDGKHIISAGTEGSLILWSASGRQIKTIARVTGCDATKRQNELVILDAAFATEGLIAIASSYCRGTNRITLWDMDGNHTVIGDIRDATVAKIGTPAKIAISPDGKTIAAGTYSTLVWSADGKLLHTFENRNPVGALAFSPDTKILAEGGIGYSRLHSLKDGRRLHVLPTQESTRDIAWSRDSIAFATKGSNQLQIRSASTGKILASSDFNIPGRAYSIAYSPNGRTIVSGTGDGNILIWSIGATPDVLALRARLNATRSREIDRKRLEKAILKNRAKARISPAFRSYASITPNADIQAAIEKEQSYIKSIAEFTVENSGQGRLIRASEFRNVWPFTVDKGLLHCDADAVTFRVAGLGIFAVNLTAWHAGFDTLVPIWKEDKKKLRKIIRHYKKTEDNRGISIEDIRSKYTPPRINVNLSTIIRAGLELCSQK